MISKKDALTLGMLAIGGVGAAMVIGGGNGAPGALEGAKARAGGILGAQEGYGAPGTTVYSLPAQPAVTFPEAPLFNISRFLAPEPLAQPVVSRGAAGVSAAPKKVTPYLYTGGEVKAGAVSVAPWAMGITTPAEIGVTTALKRASGGAPKKTPSAPAAAPAPAKRLRAGWAQQGD